MRLAALFVLVAFLTHGTAVGRQFQPYVKGGLIYGAANWRWAAYQDMRPHRKLTGDEGRAWLTKLSQRTIDLGKRNAAMTMQGWEGPGLRPDDLLKVSTADLAPLRAALAEERIMGIALNEIAIRKERGLIKELRALALAGAPGCLEIWIEVDGERERSICLDVWQNGKVESAARDSAGFKLLKMGDPRAAVRLREMAAPKSKGSFVSASGGIFNTGELTYLLVRYADGKDSRAIQRDLSAAPVQVRYYFPPLARLKRPEIDRAILAFEKHEYHAYRKWVALAAWRREDSSAYRNALRRLKKDPVEDVRHAALTGQEHRPRVDVLELAKARKRKS